MWLWLGMGCAWIGPAEFEQRLADSDVPACDDARYVDGDGDGFGAGAVILACPDDPGTVAVAGDCDDADAAVHPGVADDCDGVNDDCDGEVDEDADKSGWFADVDHDTFGAAGSPTVYACAQPPDTSARGGDCDDTDADVRPDALEVCANGKDDNCDGIAGPDCRPHGRVATPDADVLVSDAADGIGCDLVIGNFTGDDPAVDLVGTGRISRRLHAFFGPLQAGDRRTTADLSVTLGGSAAAEVPTWATDAGDRDHDGARELFVTTEGVSGRGEVALFEAPLGSGSKPLVVFLGAEKDDCLGCYDARLGRSPVAPLGDFDGDGYDDLAAIAPGAGLGGVVYVFSGAEAGSVDADDAIAAFTSLDGEAFAGPVADAGDGDDDGYDDLALRVDAPSGVVLLRGDTPGGPALAAADVSFASDAEDFGAQLALCDDIGDGRAALAIASRTGLAGSVAILPIDGAGEVSADDALGRFDAPSATVALSCQDVDADGVSDLTAGHTGPDADVAVSYGPLDRTSDATTPADWVIGGAGLLPLVTEDVNGDGVRDIAFGDCDDATFHVFFGGGF